MDKLSGLILDVYDDRSGDVLRQVFPTLESLPDLVKTAHALTDEDRQDLPDDAFALVLVNDGVELKKYATIDPGNTALSVEYFLKTGHKLPVEAQKVAATNLLAACSWYGIEAPEMLKQAGLGTALYNVGSLTKALVKSPATRRRVSQGITESINQATKQRGKAQPSLGDSVKRFSQSVTSTGKGMAKTPMSSSEIIRRSKNSQSEYRAPRAPNPLTARPQRNYGGTTGPGDVKKKASVEKLALNLRKIKKNLDNAPERPPMIKGLKKEAVSKKWIKRMVENRTTKDRYGAVHVTGEAYHATKVRDFIRRQYNAGGAKRDAAGDVAAAVIGESQGRRAVSAAKNLGSKVLYGVGTGAGITAGALGVGKATGMLPKKDKLLKKEAGLPAAIRKKLTPEMAKRVRRGGSYTPGKGRTHKMIRPVLDDKEMARVEKHMAGRRAAHDISYNARGGASKDIAWKAGISDIGMGQGVHPNIAAIRRLEKFGEAEKSAFMGAIGTGLGVVDIASQLPTVRQNMRAAAGSKHILTPSQIARRAGTGV